MHHFLLFCLLFALSLGAAPKWEFRYGHQPDQKPEWTRMGRVPAFRITEGEDSVSFADAEDGRCRGWVFSARELEVPKTSPAHFVAEVEYQLFCSIDGKSPRSGLLYFFLATPEAWNSLAKNPETEQKFSYSLAPEGMRLVAIRGHGDDCLEWTPSGPRQIGVLPLEMRNSDKLFAGIAWGTFHFNEERGAFRKLKWTMKSKKDMDREFWEKLNLDHPGLEAVKQAISADDTETATAELARYYRQRSAPLSANPVPVGNPTHIHRADETLAHIYRLAGCKPYTFPGEIVWNADPFNYNQWPVALNRHLEWRWLAGAYLKTKDEKYAREWNDQVLHWIRSMPVLIAPGWIEGPYNTPGKTSLSLDAGIRTGQSWFPSFEVFKKSPSVKAETILAFLRSCQTHGEYFLAPENFRLKSNWGAMESNGLYHLGALLPEFKDAELWRRTAMERTMAMIDYQVYPDGAQTELAPGYHGVSLRNFLGVMRVAQANNLEIPEDFSLRLKGMFEYYLRIADPGLRYPGLNDSGRGSIVGFMREAVELFPDNREFLWAANQRRGGSPPKILSNVMPWAGWVVFRSDWSPDANYLLFDAGPFGTGHQHEDKLGIQLYAYGRPLISECGKYAYDTSQWRKYCLSTRGHSTLRIDDQEQNCRADRPQHRASKPDTYGFFDCETSSYARDTHVSGYGKPADKSVRHRRRVLFVKPNLFLVVDDLAASDDRVHEAEIQFLLNVEDASLDTASHIATSSREKTPGRIGIIPLCRRNLGARIAKGETRPTVRGFIPKGFEKLEPAPAILYTRKFRRQTTLAWLLVPFAGEKLPVQLQSATLDGETLHATLRLADNDIATVHCSPTTLSWKDTSRAFFDREPQLAE